jgi:hypothetical protein
VDLSEREVIAERLRRNGLLGGAGMSSAAEVVEALCGLQAQDLPAARLAVRPRSRGPTDAAVEAARVGERAFVRTWAMRGTLHLVASKDLPWLRRLLSPGSIRANARRSAELGLDERSYSQALRSIDEALSKGRALPRAGLKEALEEAGVDSSGQRMVYLLARATQEGLICEGPMEGRYPTYVRVEDWLGPAPSANADRDEDVVRLVRRYLDAYGPAGPEDLAGWSGLPVPECRDAFGRADLAEVRAAGTTLWVTGDVAGEDPSGVRLLPAFDTFLLGYRDRALHLDPAFARRVNAGGGIVKPVLMVDGRVAGTWRLIRKAGGLKVTVQTFVELPGRALRRLEEEVGDVGRFLGSEAVLSVEPGGPPA